MNLSEDQARATISGTTKPEAPAPPADMPPAVGRYRVVRLLGEGGFGRVYLAHDDQLDRPVAVKVPHRHLVGGPEDVAAYLAEARALARLDHPNIVPVYDANTTADGLCFVVSKFIEGGDLADKLRGGRPPFTEAAGLVAVVAEALHHAHTRGLVHRDVKPRNLLIDPAGRPYVADFGLALRDEDYGRGATFAGTPAYMSPEQARGEGHRVDGRSDVFSLGVVFYELLTGRRPFRGETRDELLARITAAEPRPPRQVDDAIPKELERICLKALAKRASERYTTARDLADDLRHFLAAGAPNPTRPSPAPPDEAPAATPTPGGAPSSDRRSLRVVPKGLRPFDDADADFFLELLPGPRDRDGLPEPVRFWKAALEAHGGDKGFAVGLLYGPSGCGKSSLVKAGLLPRLSPAVVPLFIEATAGETETRLARGLARLCPDLPAGLGLADALAAVRRGKGTAPGRKLVLVLDQFEQWLHARGKEEDTELARALRQCDGERLQCLLIVRDDFWMAVSRFLRELEVGLVEGRNAAAVDLFSARHARRVLAAFGRAFEALPPAPGEPTREQEAFLDQAVAGLAQDGKVSPVRLALFAEMVKGRPWTPSTLKAVGGAEGVGVAFLEETFGAATARPEHRWHQKAARAVLGALLPQAGDDLKGHMRSHDELLRASGYAGRPADFERLLAILDADLRLITPTDPAAPEAGGEDSPAAAGGRYYQLTHDYLVPALRDWLTRKRKETARGRAELRLAERAARWEAKPEGRNLPSWWEWLNIRLLTRKRDWTTAQRQLMGRAGRYHAGRALVLAAVLLLAGWGAWEYHGRLKAEAFRDRLLDARPEEVSGIVAELAPYRRWADPLLREAYDRANDPRQRLHLALALLPEDPGRVEYLYGELLRARPEEFWVIREALAPYRKQLVGRLWQELKDRGRPLDRRFRAAAALAAYAPDDPGWAECRRDVAAKLVTENPLVLGAWTEAFRPAGRQLLPPLAALLEDEEGGPARRRTAADLYKTFAGSYEEAFALLERRLAGDGGQETPGESKTVRAKRQANVAAALAAMGRGGKVWPLLKHLPDPTVRSYLVERLGPGGVEPEELVNQFDRQPDVSIRRALLLALGGFDPERLPPTERDRLAPKLQKLYRDDPDPGLHAAAGWLLRHWGRQDKLREIDQGLATGRARGGRRWYVNREGQTMVIVPAPGEFEMGEGKNRHRQRIGWAFAIAAREVTVEEFRRFRKGHPVDAKTAPQADCPVNSVTWYQAAEYCNWLSRRDGLPEDQWCYLPNRAGKYEEGMVIPPDLLERTGYRLPTDVEWEFAARAGSQTKWACGEADDRLLGKYAWFYENSYINAAQRTSPVATLKPNDLGLFDMHGNVFEWCQDEFKPGRANGRAALGGKGSRVTDAVIRSVRGGSFRQRAPRITSAERSGVFPGHSMDHVGFRPARTVR